MANVRINIQWDQNFGLFPKREEGNFCTSIPTTFIGSSAKEVLLSSHLSIYHDHCLRWNSDKNPNDMKKTTYPKGGKRNRWNLQQGSKYRTLHYSVWKITQMSHRQFANIVDMEGSFANQLEDDWVSCCKNTPTALSYSKNWDILDLQRKKKGRASWFLNEEVSKEMMTLKWLEHSSNMKTPSHYYYWLHLQ